MIDYASLAPAAHANGTLDVGQLNQLHEEAMVSADLGFAARDRGHEDAAEIHFRRALDLEKRAALLLVNYAVAYECPNEAVEPTRSVLLRSAATLALLSHKNREAEKLAALALLGEPPPDVLAELHDILGYVGRARNEGVVWQAMPIQPPSPPSASSPTSFALISSTRRSIAFMRDRDSTARYNFPQNSPRSQS